MTINEDGHMVTWLRAAMTSLREIAAACATAGVPMTTWNKEGLAAASYGPRVVLDGIAADEAILAEHTTGGRPHCSRCVASWSYDHDGCADCAEEPHETPQSFLGACPTVRFLATRYRHVYPGWRGEWAS